MMNSSVRLVHILQKWHCANFPDISLAYALDLGLSVPLMPLYLPRYALQF